MPSNTPRTSRAFVSSMMAVATSVTVWFLPPPDWWRELMLDLVAFLWCV